VPKADRDGGRSRSGYRCNIELVGQYAGDGTSWVSASYDHCAYLPQAYPSSLRTSAPGVRVVDVADPAHPRLTGNLTTPAMLGNPWESLKVHAPRGLLGGAMGGALEGTAFFDLYDVGTDCAAPRLLASVGASDLGVSANLLGHEGGFSPDGRTYWATGGAPGFVTAIDVSDPHRPHVLTSFVAGNINHGISFSPDGRLLHLSTIDPNGLLVLDVGQVQDRKPVPQVTEVGRLTWTDGGNAQQTVPFTGRDGRSYLVAADEMHSGSVRILDVTEPAHPRLVTHVRLEIHLPSHADVRAQDTAGTGLFGYDAHYCAVDRPSEPSRLACGFFNSGVRVFDISDLDRVREVGYFNPPAQTGREGDLAGSEHASGVASRGGASVALSAVWCSSAGRVVGADQLWVSCQDNGFLALRLRGPARPSGAAS
jgi:hypothetical protein